VTTALMIVERSHRDADQYRVEEDPGADGRGPEGVFPGPDPTPRHEGTGGWPGRPRAVAGRSGRAVPGRVCVGCRDAVGFGMTEHLPAMPAAGTFGVHAVTEQSMTESSRSRLTARSGQKKPGVFVRGTGAPKGCW
jgi:hypothetical protein